MSDLQLVRRVHLEPAGRQSSYLGKLGERNDQGLLTMEKGFKFGVTPRKPVRHMQLVRRVHLKAHTHDLSQALSMACWLQ